MPIKIALLGSTGSIGTQTLDIVRANPSLFEVTTITSNNNWELLVAQAREFQPDSVVIADKARYAEVKEALADLPVKIYAGAESLEQVVAMESVDVVVAAIVGYAGLMPVVRALEAGKKVALANKESLVVAGDVLMRLALRHNAPIIPIDSEHSAIFQSLVGEVSPIEKLILTASGGPFLRTPLEKMAEVSVAQALDHPRWSMGAKITIDSATMMNKGFEVIEAKWLFDVSPGQIEVLVHPQSVVHSMVQFHDGAVKAQLGTPDMHVPIQYALSFPKRLPLSGERLDFGALARMEFFAADIERFPCLGLAYEALRLGGNSAAVVNAANEVAVRAFLDERIRFTSICRTIEYALSRVERVNSPSLEDYCAADAEARRVAEEFMAGAKK